MDGEYDQLVDVCVFWCRPNRKRKTTKRNRRLDKCCAFLLQTPRRVGGLEDERYEDDGCDVKD